MAVVGGVALDACGIANHDRLGWNRAGDNRTRADHRATPDSSAGQDGGIGADGCTVLHDGLRVLRWMLLAPGEKVVREGRVGADENIVAQPDAIPQLHATFDCRPVADNHIILDEHAIAHVAVVTDPGAGQDMGECPDARAVADVAGFAKRMLVDEGHQDPFGAKVWMRCSTVRGRRFVFSNARQT